MRLLVALAMVVFTSPAGADLYRWVDPESGSVKFSSYPPPWYGDPEKERRAPKVERIPSGAPKPAAAATPAAPAAQKADGLATLVQRYKSILRSLSVLPADADFSRAGAGFQQQMEAYNAVAAELDRLDPKGSDRREAEAQPLLDRLLEGLRTQVSPKPPAPLVPKR